MKGKIGNWKSGKVNGWPYLCHSQWDRFPMCPFQLSAQRAASRRLTTVGRRAFAVHGPMDWNSLPDDLRAQQDYESFRQGLKTWLFSRYYRVQRIGDFRDNSAI